MKASFFHDHVFRFSRNGSGYFSDGKLVSRSWDRYLQHFDQLVVCARSKEVPSSELRALEPSGSGNVDFSLLGFHKSKDYLIQSPRMIAHIQSVVRQSDAVIARLPSFVGAVACDVALLCSKPLAVEVVGDGLDAWKSLFGSRMATAGALLDRRMARHVRKSDAACYVTSEYLQQRYPCDGEITCAASNVELDWALVEDSGGAAREYRSAFREHDPVGIGLIGSFTQKNKGIDVVIRALPDILSRYPKAKFRVLGGGDPASLLELAKHLRVADSVEFCGLKSSGAEVYSWLQDVDLYLQPSRVEGLPRALIEAMAMGCPAIGSNVAGIPELLDPEMILDELAPEALARMVVATLDDSSKLRAQSVRNFDRAKRYEASALKRERSRFWGQFAELARQAV